jgi:glycosyltransferase involved in cell wall biosynthesis
MQQFEITAWIAMARGTLSSDLRRIGFERSSRDIVVFLDDDDQDRQEWSASLFRNWSGWTDTGGRVINAPRCGAESDDQQRYPYLSVVLPVHNGGPRLLLALQSLALTNLPRSAWELVVVDDASSDESAIVAAQYADRILRLRHGPYGPGYARNRGFELTLGECVAFVNADVMVETDTLRNAVTVLTTHPDVGAVFGSCDASAMTPGFLSDYRSLVQRYYHRSTADDAFTFSSACGVIRSSVFESAGGYDEWHFARRQLEDFELAQRIRSLGERIILDTGIRAARLRKWTLRRMIATEIFGLSVPRMRLKAPQRRQDLGWLDRALTRKTANIVLSWLAAILAAVAWPKHNTPASLGALACVIIVAVNNAAELAFFARERGIGFAVLSLPLDVLYYLIAGIGVVFGWIARQALGEPTPGAVTEAFVEMGTKRWPPVPVKRLGRSSFVAPTATAESSGLADIPLLPHNQAASNENGIQKPFGDRRDVRA